MVSTNGGIQNEFLEKAHLKASACREVCLTTKFDFWRLFDNILISFVIFDQSRTMETDNNMPRSKNPPQRVLVKDGRRNSNNTWIKHVKTLRILKK